MLIHYLKYLPTCDQPKERKMSSLFHGKFNLARQNSTNNESSKCSPVEKVELLRQISTGSQKSYGSNYEYNSDSEIEDEGTKEEQTDLNESKFTNFTDEAEKIPEKTEVEEEISP